VEDFRDLVRAPSVPEVWTGALVVNPDRAREWLLDCHYPGQRRLTDTRVRLYQQEMASGLWRLSELRFARLPDGRAFLLNGYTRLHAILATGLSLPFTITLVDVASMNDVAAEYATLDAHRVRQTKDLLRGYDLDEQLGFPVSDQERVARTAGILASGFGKASHLRFARTVQFRLPYLLEWAPVARIVFDAIHTGHSPDPPTIRITNAPIFAVALVTARFQPDKSQAFWGAVAANDGLRRGQPDWILRDFLARLSTSTVREWPGMSRRVAACWNAYMEDRPMAFARAEPSRETGDWAPIKLIGTPYDGQTTVQLYGGGTLIPGTEPPDQKAVVIYRAAERAAARRAAQ
jgi:hypothetical protein